MTEPMRVPITKEEFYAVKTFGGMLTVFDEYIDRFEHRLRMIPNGIKRWKWVRTMMDNIFKDIIQTVPCDKLAVFKYEIQNSRTECYTVKNKNIPHEFAYIDAEALQVLTDQIMADHCLVCDKTGKECRQCPIRTALDNTVTWETKSIRKGECIYNGLTTLFEEEVQHGDKTD